MICTPIQPKTVFLTNEQLSNFDTFEKISSIDTDVSSAYTKPVLSKITSNLNSIIKDNLEAIKSYPTIYDRYQQLPLTTVEVAEFMQAYLYNEIEMFNYTSGYVNTGTILGAESLFYNLNFFLDRNAAAGITGGFCSAFGNTFAKLSELSMFVGGAGALLSGLANFSLASLIGPIMAIKDKIFSLVDNLSRNLMQQVGSMIQNLTSSLSGSKGNNKGMFVFINKKAQNIKEFLSDLNMKTLKEKIEAVMTSMAGQFQELTLDNIAFLMFRLCQLAEMVQNFLQNPMEKFQSMIFQMTANMANMSTYSATNAQHIINNGGMYIPIPDRASTRRAAAQEVNQNVTSGSIQPGTFIAEDITDEEMNWVAGLTKDGDGNIKFSSNVQVMGTQSTNWFNSLQRGPYNPDENFPDAGWKMIANTNPSIFIMLRRVSKKMGIQLTLNSGFRSPYYNWYIANQGAYNNGVARHSKHMEAKACDISTSNMSSDQTAQFIQHCSEEGFNRLSVYGTFVHVDIAPGANRGNWTGNYRGNDTIKRAVELHLRDAFRHGG